MRTYMLMKKKNIPITVDDFLEITEDIERGFPGSFEEKTELGLDRVRGTYNINGTPLYVYYRNSETQAIIPAKGNLEKRKFESKTRLILQRQYHNKPKCQ